MENEMTMTEAAAYLKNTRDYIRVLIMRGQLRRSRQLDGRTYFIDRASVVAFDDARRAKKTQKKARAATTPIPPDVVC